MAVEGSITRKIQKALDQANELTGLDAVEKGVPRDITENIIQKLEDALNALQNSGNGEMEERVQKKLSPNFSYHALFEQLTDAVFLFDPDGIIIEVNERGCELLGYERKELLGMPVWEMTAEEDQSRLVHTRVLQGEQVTGVERLLRRKDGGGIQVEINAELERDDQGEPLYIQNIVRDISERKREQKALEESETRYRSLFDNALDAILIADDDGRYINANPAACDMLGYTREELLSMHIWDLTLDLNRSQGVQMWQAFLDAGELRGEFTLICKEGEQVETEFQAVANVQPGEHISVMRDITRRKKTKAELEKTQNLLERTFNNLTDALFVIDTSDRTIAACNEAVEKIFGYRPEDIIGRSTNFLHVNDEQFTRFGEEGNPILQRHGIYRTETNMRRADGTAFPAEITVTIARDRDENWVNAISVVRDITAQKAARAALEESEARYRSLFDNALDGILIANDEGRYVDANPAACEILGYDRDELLTIAMHELQPGNDRTQVQKQWETFLRQKTTAGETTLVRKDGAHVEIDFRAVADFYPGLHASIMRDITRRKRMQEALRESERRLSTLMGNLPGMAYRCLNNPQWTMLFVSEGCSDLTGYAPADLTAGGEMQYVDLIHPKDRQMVWQTVQEGIQEDRPYEIVYRIRTAYGEERWVHEQGVAVPRFWKGDQVLEGFVSDVTASIEAQEHLFQRTEELQRLAARLAETEEAERRRMARELHDQVGQSLAVLSVTLNMMKGKVADTEPEKIEEKIRGSLEQVKDLTRSIRRVMEDLRPSVLDEYGLFTALETFSDRFQNQTEMAVLLVGESLSPRLPGPVENTLFRITQEALTNALRHAEASRVLIRLEDQGDQVVFRVADNGVGFELREYEPQRESGGWGLVNMRERALAVGASFDIDTAPGEGATIVVRVPREGQDEID